MKLLFCILLIAVVTTADEKTTNEYLREANEQFTARLSAEVIRQHSGESVIMSGFSVMPLLAILSQGATGITHDELLNVLNLPNDNVTKEVFSNSMRTLKSIKGVTLDMANKIYVGKDLELNYEFAAVSKTVFNADLQNIDFTNSQQAASEINSWVESQTNNRIKDIVSPDSLTPATASILVNAIYFKGTWKNKFSEQLTNERDFYINKDKKVKVPMMYTDGNYLYGESKELNAKLIEIPYEGDEVSFMVILPNDIEGLPKLQQKLSHRTLLRNAESEMSSTDVEVFLPKFKIETKTNLLEALTNMQLKTIFSPDAELTKLLKGGHQLYVAKATQKAFIEVNEEGTEAAAANVAHVQYLSAYVGERIIFDANHPFIFNIKIGGITTFSGVYKS